MSLHLQGNSPEENERVRKDLTARIRELVRPDTLATEVAHDWAFLDYSSCFSIEWMRPQSRRGVFVKIPKTQIDRNTVLPSCDADRVLGHHEYASLTYLGQHWNGSEARVGYVNPLAFFEDCNAIVTERIYAGELLSPFRRAVLSPWDRGGAVLDALRRIGSTLRFYHRRSQAREAFPSEPFEGERVIRKIERISEDLCAVGVREPLSVASHEALQSWMAYCPAIRPTMTLKGLDIRNMFVDSEGRVSLLDPGRLKKDVPEADLARLLVTIQILFWGTLLFFIRVQPPVQFMSALVDGYGRDGIDLAVLRLFIVKELFKHWRMAYVALTRKQWPRVLELALSAAYIDAFYRAESARAIERLSATAQTHSSPAKA